MSLNKIINIFAIVMLVVPEISALQYQLVHYWR